MKSRDKNRKRTVARQVILVVSILFVAIALTPKAFCDSVPFGASRFHFQGPKQPLPVWTYRPAGHGAKDPVLFIMHGAKRDPQAYRIPWISQAERLGIMLILPEFSKRNYPHSRDYQQMGVRDSEGRVRSRENWASELIESIFDYLVEENTLQVKQYYLYGHSAGGQFVHRMMLLNPEARVALALPANAGWYTLPLLDRPYPEGLDGALVDEKKLVKSMRNEVIVLLGDADDDPKHKLLPKNAAAVHQGVNRFERGKFFYAEMENAAKSIDTDLNWRLQVVPNIGHSNTGMAPVAADLIAEHLRQTHRDRTSSTKSESLSK